MQLPKNISEIRWKNKDTKRYEIRYRVRVNRKDLKIDKMFDDLNEAKELAFQTYSQAGRKNIANAKEEKLTSYEIALKDAMQNPNFSYFIDMYERKYIDNNDQNLHPAKKRSISINKNRLKTIQNLLICYAPSHLRGEEFTGWFDPKTIFKDNKKRLGDFELRELDRAVADEYVRERLKTASKSTVKREIGQLQTIINKLQYIAPQSAKMLAENPFKFYDRKLLKGHDEKRERRITPKEEEKLFLRLAGMRNHAMLQIVSLALATGMRRSEIIYLNWSNIKDNSIELQAEATKSGKRKLLLTDEAKAILKTIKKIDGQERLFKYTIEGFKTNFYRAVKQAGIENLKFHDFRREFITRMIVALQNPNAITVSQFVGMKSVEHIERQYIKPVLEERKEAIDNIETLMKSVGHAKLKMLAHYAQTLIQDK